MVILTHQIYKLTYFGIWWRVRHRRCCHSHYEFSVTWANQRDIRAGDFHGYLAYLGTMVLLLTPLSRSRPPQSSFARILLVVFLTVQAMQTKHPSLSAGPGAGESVWSEMRKRAFVEGLGLNTKTMRALLSGCNSNRRLLRSKAAQAL